MSSAAHDTFTVIFGIVGVAHLALAWLTWQRNARKWRDSRMPAAAKYGQEAAEIEYRRAGGPFMNPRERLHFNAQIALGVFFGLLAVAGGFGAY
ncbi:hypothetical protein [Streptomyces prasinopilosus]|uniref:hypothetical protein n=1 Tax=Streptomyces prasinopilosus TaxID=67344 RepID=UPI0006EBAA1B|nr:hypothetical protein [Streptomyces prasinopilosus]